MVISPQQLLNKIVHDLVRKKEIFGAVFHVQNTERTIDVISAAGNINAGSVYFIASINKLMISALTLRLVEQGKLDLQHTIDNFFNAADIDGIATYKGRDYANTITVRQLLSQTSGLPCYLLDLPSSGPKNMDLLRQGKDQCWPLHRVLEAMRNSCPKFIPGTSGKANYSETNFLILAGILEKVTGKEIGLLFQEVFQELNMSHSVVLPSPMPIVPTYFKTHEVALHEYWRSTGHNIASTAGDQMVFLRAFFGEYFFSESLFADLRKWNRIFMPFQYGIGLQRIRLPRIFSPFKPLPQGEGHSGSVGSVAFKMGADLFVTGTVNQSAAPAAAIQTLYKIYRQFSK